MRVDRAVRQCAVVLAVLLGATAPAAAADPASPADPPPASELSGDDESGPLNQDEPTGEDQPVSDAERAVALAEPAIAVIEVRWEGYLHHRDTGELCIR